MKEKDMVVGTVYLVRIGGSPRLSRVRIDRITPGSERFGARARARWEGTNLATGRIITGGAARLRMLADVPSKLGWSQDKARGYARLRARAAGLDMTTADAVAHSVMVVWDDQFTIREWNNFVDEEITRHAHP